MGQGLIQWQGLAFKKSASVTAIKRQSAILRPYSSAGEFYFHRGAGITLKKNNIESTFFISYRKLGANLVNDTLSHEEFISSLLTSGYHRTINENADKNNLAQTAIGANVTYSKRQWHISINGINYNFSAPVQKKNEPYNLYAIKGTSWYNYSVDYSYTYKNLHLFGEAAADKNMDKAFVNGALLSVDPRVDVTFLHRNISKAFQSLYGNAFTENTSPSNESGFYMGISIRPVNALQIDGYADFFKFPWLKYLVDAPSSGKEFLVQLTYTPNKLVEFYTRLKMQRKQSNESSNTTITNYLVAIPKQNWRTQVSYKVDPAINLKCRTELLWYDKGSRQQTGFLQLFDIAYVPMLKPYSGILRLQYFETDGYDARIYAYENDVLYSYSIPAFFDKGFRYYVSINYDLNKKFSVWLRWAQTIYDGPKIIGTGADEIPGSKKSEIKLQTRWLF
jgi:hypothetical protein